MDGGASAHATTVHPLLGNFEQAWAGCGVRSPVRSDKKAESAHSRLQQAIAARALRLDDLQAQLGKRSTRWEIGVREGRLSLQVGLQVPLEKAAAAFAHLAAGKPGRAVLLPGS